MDIRAHVIELNTRRLRAVAELNRQYDETAGRERSAEELATIARIDAEIDGIDAEVRTFVDRETRETEAAQLRANSEHLFGEAAVTRGEQSQAQSLRSWMRGETRNAETVDGRVVNTMGLDLSGVARERELLRSGASAEEIRALAWDTGSIASGVPTTLARSLYEYVTASVAVMRMPTYKFATNAGEQMKFPRVNAHGIATQVSGQGTALAGTDATFLSMTMDAYKYGELYAVANEVISDTAFDIVDFVSRNVGRAVGEKIGTDLAVGTGSGQPLGVSQAVLTGSAGTIATGGSLITPTYENLVDLVYSVNGNYRARPSTAFLMRDLTAGVVRKLRDGNGGTLGSPLWAPTLTNGITGAEPDRLLGYPVWTDPNIASCASNAKIMVFGDFSAYYVRTVGNFMFERDDSRYFDTDQVAFRGKWRVDGDCIDLTALNLLKQSV